MYADRCTVDRFAVSRCVVDRCPVDKCSADRCSADMCTVMGIVWFYFYMCHENNFSSFSQFFSSHDVECKCILVYTFLFRIHEINVIYTYIHAYLFE